MKAICIYHGNCADGFGAAWVVRKALGDIEFHAGVYQNDPPDVTGKHVIMVDFSYKRDVLLKMAKTSEGVLVLDHHKSALEDLAAEDPQLTNMAAKYTGTLSWERFLTDCAQDRSEGIPDGRIYTLFDMNRSGAGLTWDFFFPNQPRPPLIDRIEDRDLWRFKYADTRAVQANVFSFPYNFEMWDWLMVQPLEDLKRGGEAIERKHFKDIAELLKTMTREMSIAGYRVPVANLPYIFSSDAGHMMAKGRPFAACYWDTPEGRVFSLRSSDGIDVSAVAAQYGGGGHRSAAGFRVSFEKAREFEVYE